MTMKYWPNDEKPREKLLKQGAQALSDAEVLAIFLRTGIKGKPVLQLARELLSHFGSLHQLFNASRQALCGISGMGPTKYVELQAIIELSKRYAFEKSKYEGVVNNPAQTKAFLLARFGKKEQEVFSCLFLNNKNQVIVCKELFQGSINRMEIYPREVVRYGIMHNAVSVICVHNHPSGDARPSQMDIDATRHLQQALKWVDMRLLDHIIVGGNQAVSLAEEGIL